MKPNIKKLIDLRKMEILLKNFYQATGFVTAISDLEDNVLFKIGWREICTDFHRVHPKTKERCAFSDSVLAGKIEEGEKYHTYTCQNGLTDVVVPLHVSGEHVANLFSGQFFFEEPDIAYFKNQAREFGFDEKSYLTSLMEVPIFSKEKVKGVIDFLLQMTDSIIELGFEKIEQIELNNRLSAREQELRITNQQLLSKETALKESETRYKQLVDTAVDAIYLINGKGRVIDTNHKATLMLEKSKDEIIGQPVEVIDPNFSVEAFIAYWEPFPFDEQRTFETSHMDKSGAVIPIEISGKKFKVNDEVFYYGIARDISERKTAEKTIQESEERFKKISELSTDYSYSHLYDEEGNFTLEWSFGAFKQITGYEPEESVKLEVLANLIHPEDWEEAKKRAERIQNGETVVSELRIVTKDGEVKWIRDKGVPEWDRERERVIRCLGTAQEITERKKAEQKILEQYEELISAVRREEEINDRFNKAMQAGSDGIFDWNLVTNDIYYSPRWKGILGYQNDELPDDFSVWETLTKPEDVKRSWEMLNSLIEGKIEKFDMEFKMKHKDGYWVDIHSRADVFRNNEGKIYRVVGTHTDITERKKAEKQMHFLSAVTEKMHDAIVVTDLKGRITYINKSAHHLFGYTLDELSGKNPGIFNIDSKADEIQAEIFKTVAKGESYQGEALNRRKDGSEFICEFKVAPLTDEQGVSTSYIAIERDITEIRNLEKSAIRQERLSAIGELASGIAHDFNNALQIILGGVELAMVSEEPAELDRYLQSIKDSASDAASRVRQIQRFSQKSHVKKESLPININNLVADVINETGLLLNQYQEKGLHIEVLSDYRAKSHVEGEEGELRACLFNLFKNSAEAMPDGGQITISTDEWDGKVYVSVADTGIGMDKETQKKIFQPFFSTKGFEPGRGLGMTQVYSTIRDYNGDIYIKEAEVGKGTVIELYLPVSIKQPGSERKEADYVGTARILWVDDEEMILTLSENMLKTLGHSVDVAASGKDALELLSNGNQYDLVITDVGMPGMSGWQLAEQIKKSGYKTRIAVVTGWGAEVSEEEKSRYNVGYVLGKPITLKTLKALIGEVLQMKNISDKAP